LPANADQAGTPQQVEVVGNRRAAERDALGDLADIQFGTSQQLHQVLAHRIGPRARQSRHHHLIRSALPSTD
jgi:hypothetical protein